MSRALPCIAMLFLAVHCSATADDRTEDTAPGAGSSSGASESPSCSPDAAWIAAADRATAHRWLARFERGVGRCPSSNESDELLYIWKENSSGWAEFPAQEDLFLTANLDGGGPGVRRELIGQLFADAKQKLSTDPDLPMEQDRGPTHASGMTLYEFSGGMSVYLVVVRDGRVATVYFFDQV